MTNMTAYEMLNGFINYFMYNATDFSKKDIASALSTLSDEFNDANTVRSNDEYKDLLKEWVKAYPVVSVTCDIRNFAKIQELLDKTNEVLKCPTHRVRSNDEY